MGIILIIDIFVLGAIIGSFLNVVILRYGTGMTIGGRSVCLSCGKKLSWYELIPFISFFIQGGRCRGCSSRISWQYPAVEGLTGLLFVLLFLSATNSFALIYELVVWAILIVITVYDVRHQIIPDGLVFALAFIALAWHIFVAFALHADLSGWYLLAGPILFCPFWFLWFISKGEWIGLGDGKLALAIGWIAGLSGGVSAIVLGFWIGAVASIGIIMIGKIMDFFGRRDHPHLSRKSQIPLAPFLILGLLLVAIWHIDISTLFIIH
jgi:leader peptidase (prepilin peptidase) / N-methyltransferase